MDNEYIESLRKQVKKALKKDKQRYKHTLGVADTAACLAMRYDIDMQSAYIANVFLMNKRLKNVKKMALRYLLVREQAHIFYIQSWVHFMPQVYTILMIKIYVMQLNIIQQAEQI